MTFAEMIDYYSYKFGLVCLRETTTGEFCTEVEAGWDIRAIDSSGAATWPQNTRKVYPDTRELDWPNLVDDNGTAVDPFVDDSSRKDTEAQMVIPGNENTFREYLDLDREPSTGEDSNYGWDEALEFDEYPLEIQCSPCFM